MKTRYIYTAKAEQIARENNLPEYRKAGTAASFAWQPLENSEITARAWLEAGIIEKVEKPVNFLTFTWITTANNAMTKIFRENNISYYFRNEALYADIYKTGEPVEVDCYHIAKDPETGLNLFGVMEAPKRTTQYFNLTSEELYKTNSDGYTKEEALLCDNCPDAHPFADDYISALEKFKYYVEMGYKDIQILQRINNKYAVVAY